jgi:hypothetical protein
VDLLPSIFLYLHIGGVIVAFGPTMGFALIGSQAAKEPMHGNFALRVTEFITRRLVEPGAVFVFLMGVGLIWSRGWNPFTTLWLALAIIIFLGVFAYSLGVQAPTVRKMIELTATPPPPPAEGQPAGPPPAFVALQKKVARGGILLSLGLFTILFLMVFKPTL